MASPASRRPAPQQKQLSQNENMDKKVNDALNDILRDHARPYSGNRGLRSGAGGGSLRRRRASNSFNEDSQGSSVTFADSFDDYDGAFSPVHHDSYPVESPDKKFTSLTYDYDGFGGGDASDNTQRRLSKPPSATLERKPESILRRTNSSITDAPLDAIAQDAARSFRSRMNGRRIDNGSLHSGMDDDDDEDDIGFHRVQNIIRTRSTRPMTLIEKNKEKAEASNIRNALAANTANAPQQRTLSMSSGVPELSSTDSRAPVPSPMHNAQSPKNPSPKASLPKAPPHAIPSKQDASRQGPPKRYSK